MLTRAADAALQLILVRRERETVMEMMTVELVLSVVTTTANNSGLSSTPRTTAA